MRLSMRITFATLALVAGGSPAYACDDASVSPVFLGGAVILYPLVAGMVFLILRRNATAPMPRSQRIKWVMSLAVWIALVMIFVPSVMVVVDRGRQKETMGNMRKIAMAVESHAERHAVYPVAGSMEELNRILGTQLPTHDGWGGRFHYAVPADRQQYVIVSRGKDRVAEMTDPWKYPAGTSTTDFRRDIVFESGVFRQYPEGLQC